MDNHWSWVIMGVHYATLSTFYKFEVFHLKQ